METEKFGHSDVQTFNISKVYHDYSRTGVRFTVRIYYFEYLTIKEEGSHLRVGLKRKKKNERSRKTI